MHISQAWAVFARRSLRTAMIWSLAGVALIGCSEVQEKYGFRTLGVPRPVSVSEPDNPQAGLRSVGFARMGAQGRDALTRDVYDYGGGSRTWGGGPMLRVDTDAAGRNMTLNFVEASIREVVDAVLGETLEVPYVFDERVSGTVTARTTDAIPRATVIPMLENILALHGAAMIEDQGVYHIVPRDAVRNLPKTVVTPGSHPIGRGAGVYVIPLSHASAASVSEVVTGQVGEGSQLAVDTTRNIMIFTGPETEARAIMELASVLDVDVLADKSFALFPVQRASAESIVGELQTMFESEGEAVRFLPVNRLNAVLVVSRQRSTLARVGRWVDRLDKADTRAGMQTFVYYAKNSRAVELASVLSQAFGATTVSSAGADAGRVAPGLEPALLQTSASVEGNEAATAEIVAEAAPALAAAEARGSGGTSTSGIRVVADDRHNALVIMATSEQIRLVRDVLDRIDVMPLQVLIEATIAEVTLNDDLKYGVQWALSQGNYNINWANTATGAIGAAYPGSNLSYRNPDAQAVLSALSEITEVQVVSSPQLMVLDNQSARLQIGDQVPVLTQSATSTNNADAVVVNSVQYVDTGVIFEVTPRVNASGLVTLDILQEVSDPSGTSASTIQSPTIQQRRIQSTVAVQSGATVGLGGLIRDRSSRGESGVPVLKDVPGLGNLFKTNSRSGDRTELLVLITPRVIRNPAQAWEVAQELRQRVRLLR
ncbi:MAG: type II secretion system protein GspD [Rhodobacteraceae bacterium]|jgi:general secretion pathway protein D|nr:type II secretion system secretin GspD [Salipiger profundus]MAB07642.1 type II secretion system protein GspD [Paracoccaceae bacterium]GFZ97321.1 type II secretion system protein GspD [Salipiger profundus]SFD01238.1 type II secretion system protein D (GspD) [Salipiger profundus]